MKICVFLEVTFKLNCKSLIHLCHWFFLYSIKTLENMRFYDAFKGYRKRTVELNKLNGARNNFINKIE